MDGIKNLINIGGIMMYKECTQGNKNTSHLNLGHPCFSTSGHGKTGRIHLAVAPGCNISCNYCVRKFDCANESRPGVTSRVQNSEEALLNHFPISGSIVTRASDHLESRRFVRSSGKLQNGGRGSRHFHPPRTNKSRTS